MWRVYLFLSLATMIAAFTPIGARAATSELPPLTLAFVRFATAGVLLAITGRMLGLRPQFTRREWPMLILLAAICVPLNQIGFLVGVQYANASHAGIAYVLVPVLTYWIALTLGRTHFSRRMVAASALACLGATVAVLSTGKLVGGGSGSLTRLLVGDALLVSAAFTWALFTVLSQPVVRRFGAISTLTAVFLIGTVLQIPLVAVDYVWMDLASFRLADVTWRGFAGMGFITLITAYVNYLLIYFVIARYDVARAAIVVNASFLITVLAESWMYGLPLSPWLALGSVMLLGGVVLATRQAKRA